MKFKSDLEGVSEMYGLVLGESTSLWRYNFCLSVLLIAIVSSKEICLETFDEYYGRS